MPTCPSLLDGLAELTTYTTLETQASPRAWREAGFGGSEQGSPSSLTLGGIPACGPGGAGESDHQDSNCLVNSSTLAAAVSNSICFRSMCFMASAGCGSEGQDHAPYTRPLAGPCPSAPAPSLHWKFRSRRSLAFWKASLSMVPAGARCLPGWRTCSDPPGHAPLGPNPRKARRVEIGGFYSH